MNRGDDTFLDILRKERRDILDRLRETRFTCLRPGISHAQIISFASYSPWLDDIDFSEIFKAISESTLVDIYRCYELYTLARQLAYLPGEIVEVGVWRGGTAALLAKAVPGKIIHLYDTFSGVVKAKKEFDTIYTGGEHADTGEYLVRNLFKSLDLPCQIHVGVFPEDTDGALPETVSLAHIDVDTYQSALDSFLTIWPRLSINGMMIFDDYGFFGCEGVTQAVQEVLASTRNALFIYNLNGHGILTKTSP